MTALTKDMIPANIVTVEALAVWCSEVLQHLNPNLKVVEYLDEQGLPVPRRAVESNKFYYTAPEIPEWRHASRLSIGLRPEHQVSGKIWEHAKSLSDLPVPVGMRA